MDDEEEEMTSHQVTRSDPKNETRTSCSIIQGGQKLDSSFFINQACYSRARKRHKKMLEKFMRFDDERPRLARKFLLFYVAIQFLLAYVYRFQAADCLVLSLGQPAAQTRATTTTSSKQQVEALPQRASAEERLADRIGVVRQARERERRASSASSGARKKQQTATSRQQQAQSTEATPTLGAIVEQPNATGGRAIKNVTAQNGQSVFLHCFVEPNGGGELPSVSWFRGSGELQLLTYEQTTIIQDERFVVRHGIQRENDWALQIKNLDKSTDAGLYQCQTTSGTDSPQSQFYQLNIVEPQVSILGAPDLAVKVGTEIDLTCVISHTAEQLYVFWYRNERMINYDLDSEKRGKVFLSKSHNSSKLQQDTITSNLQIYPSKLSDSGNYTCQPSGARPASIQVQVLEEGDKRLIMFQNDDQSISAHPASSQQQQQTNSAHSTRSLAAQFERGHSFAFFCAFVIFSTWFNMVVQVQTGISLLLLAIIGLFLGHVTGKAKQLDRSALAADRMTARISSDDDDQESCSSAREKKKRKRQMQLDKSNENGNFRRDRDDPSQHRQLLQDDPLLDRANDAINLLKTLNEFGSVRSANSTTCSMLESIQLEADDEEQNEQDEGSSRTARATAVGCSSLLRNESLRRQFYEKSQASRRIRSPNSNSLSLVQTKSNEQPSPSASSASSSSTGYNTDSRDHSTGECQGQKSKQQLCSSPNVELVQLFCDRTSILVRPMTTPSSTPTGLEEEEEDEDEDQKMIPLIGDDQPTAMRAILDRLGLAHDCQKCQTREQHQMQLLDSELISRAEPTRAPVSRLHFQQSETIYSSPRQTLTTKDNETAK